MELTIQEAVQIIQTETGIDGKCELINIDVVISGEKIGDPKTCLIRCIDTGILYGMKYKSNGVFKVNLTTDDIKNSTVKIREVTQKTVTYYEYTDVDYINGL